MNYVLNSHRFLVLNLIGMVAFSAFVLPAPANGQDSKLVKLLSIRPRHSGFEYDQRSQSEIEKCKLQAPAADSGKRGYIVIDENGRTLRQFLDNNADDRLDQWSYYKDGIEVYRDLDTNFDSKADQHRWMGTAGLRWGLDTNQDGTIDTWRMISAEEVASEVFEAIKDGDSARFKRVLLSERELKDLGLGEKLNDTVSQSLKNAVGKFNDFAKKQRLISTKSTWVHFGTSQPSLVAAGNSGSEKDVIVYDHASAVFRNGNDYEQVAIGTVVQVAPNSWRAAELPQMVIEGKAVANGGILFQIPGFSSGASGVAQANPADEKFAKLFSDLDKIDKLAAKAKKQSDIESLEAQRAKLKTLLIENSRSEDRTNWIESLADTVTDAYQRDRYPGGLTFLAGYQRKLKSAGQTGGLDYIAWRMLNTKFSKAIDEGDQRKRSEATEEFVEDMEAFAKSHPNSRFGAECLNNLGMHYEIADRQNPKRAVEWYRKCASSFPSSDFGKKAAGAIIRLGSQGKKVNFEGKTIDGRTFSLQKQYAKKPGKIVVIHYWATWCDVCIAEFESLQRLGEKYKDDLIIIGANIDDETKDFTAFMKKNRSLRWTQLHEPGGVEKSSLAHQLGPSSLPLVVLFDSQGRLVESGIPVDELDREIQRLTRKTK